MSELVHTSISPMLVCEHDVDHLLECAECEALFLDHVCDDECFPL